MRQRRLTMGDKGEVRPFPGEAGAPTPGEPMVLLVHGFNNDAEQAGESYFTMRSNLDALLREYGVDLELRKSFQDRIWELYWPGYARYEIKALRGEERSELESKLGALSYPDQVVKARDWVPETLAAYVRRTRPSEIFFIGHSLGCRVVLETIKRLLEDQPVYVSGYLLMAAAVPIDQLGWRGRLWSAARSVRRAYALHSMRDTVLWFAFPPGQLLAGERPFYDAPIATGLAGWPAATYTSRGNTKLGHSGYWREGIFRGGNTTRDLLGAIFNLAWAKDVDVAKLLTTPVLDRVSTLPERKLAVWRLPGDPENWLAERYGLLAR